MFRNRALSITLDKKPKVRKDGSAESIECTHMDLEQISKIAQDNAVLLAKIGGAAYVAKKLIDTTCQIAVIAAQAKIK